MSIRTIVEINHDYLYDLRDHPERIQDFLFRLMCGPEIDAPIGIRVLRQRHHSEKITLEVE